MIIALLVLSFLIFFHELGHFLVARMLGVRVEVFSIGFGKKLLCKKKGNTNYCLSMIPLGGYVQMKGQDDTNPALKNFDKDSYNSKTPFQRILILLAGPAFNFLLAFLIYFSISIVGWTKLAPVIGEVIPDSNAYGKLQKNDRIIEINGIKIKEWNGIKKVVDNSNILNITIQRNNKLFHFSIKPKILETQNIFQEKIQKKLLGISPNGERVIIHYGFIGGIKEAYNELVDKSTFIFKGVEKLLTGVVSTDKISGPISIVKVTSDVSAYGIIPLLLLTALLSVNLGVLNLLPIPALDGGHIIFNLYELVIRKPLSQPIMINLTIAGWILLFGLMGLGIFNDINRLLGE